MLFAHRPMIPPPSSSSLLFWHYTTSLSWTGHQVFLSIVWYHTDYLRSLSGYYATIYSLFRHYATLLHVIWVLCNSHFSMFAIFGYYATFYSLSRNVNPFPLLSKPGAITDSTSLPSYVERAQFLSYLILSQIRLDYLLRLCLPVQKIAPRYLIWQSHLSPQFLLVEQ